MSENPKEVETSDQKKARLAKEIDEQFDKLEELVIDSQTIKFKEWSKGFAAGYGSAVVGFLIGGYVAHLIYKRSK